MVCHMTNAPCVTLLPYLEVSGIDSEMSVTFTGKLQKYRGVHRTVGNRTIIKDTCISTAILQLFLSETLTDIYFLCKQHNLS